MRILFFTQSGSQGASSRYRVYQYLPFFKAQGWKVRVAPAVPSFLHKTYFFSRSFAWKAILSVGIFARRLVQMVHVPFADIVFIQKPLLPGSWFSLEPWVAKFARKVVFDFDDAIFLQPPVGTRGLSEQGLRSRFEKAVRSADLVIAGNDFLAHEAAKFASRVQVLPTVVDTQRWRWGQTPSQKKGFDPISTVTIGWMGSPSTASYLKDVLPVMAELSRKFPVRWVFVGAQAPQLDRVQAVFEPWSYWTEAEKLRSFDIFISPLRDTPWEQGKCGLKTLTAMSTGLPVIASAVGVHKEIVQDGINGFLAAAPEEWQDKLSRLVADTALREKLGREARKTVEKSYDLSATASRLVKILQGL